MGQIRFFVITTHLLESLSELLQNLDHNNPFTNNKPGQKYISKRVKKNTELQPQSKILGIGFPVYEHIPQNFFYYYY